MNIMEFLSRLMSDDETKHGFTNALWDSWL